MQTKMQRNLVVDGFTCEDRYRSVYDSDPKIGKFPPFAVFDIDKQETIAGPFDTREEAEEILVAVRDYKALCYALAKTTTQMKDLSNGWPERELCEPVEETFNRNVQLIGNHWM